MKQRNQAGLKGHRHTAGGGGHIRGQVPGRRAPVGILGHCLDAVEGGKPWSLPPGKNKWAGTQQNPFMDEDFENIR